MARREDCPHEKERIESHWERQKRQTDGSWTEIKQTWSTVGYAVEPSDGKAFNSYRKRGSKGIRRRHPKRKRKSKGTLVGARGSARER